MKLKTIRNLARYINSRHWLYLEKVGKRPLSEGSKIPKMQVTDEILRTYRFPNVFPELDRATQRMRVLLPVEDFTQVSRAGIIRVPVSPEIELWTMIWYRAFNWGDLASDIGICETPDKLASRLRARRARGRTVFNPCFGFENEDAALEDALVSLYRVWELLPKIANEVFSYDTQTEVCDSLSAMLNGLIAQGTVSTMVRDLGHYPRYWSEGKPTDGDQWFNISPVQVEALRRLAPSLETDESEEQPARLGPALQRLLFDLSFATYSHVPELTLQDLGHTLFGFERYCRVAEGTSGMLLRYDRKPTKDDSRS